MTQNENAKKLHVAMFPWLAFGHMIPFLDLAKLIAQKGHKISFISTPRNISRLPKIPSDLSNSICFVPFTLPRDDDDNLPENAEATTDLPEKKVPYLKKAFDKLPEAFENFLEASTPDWIIYDFAHHWLPPIAERFGVSRAFFSIFNAWTICWLGGSVTAMINDQNTRVTPEDLTVPPPWVPFETKVAYRLHEARRVFEYLKLNVSGIKDTSRFGWAVAGCDVVAIKSCLELEPEWIPLLSQLMGKPVIPIGLLPPTAPPTTDDPGNDTWLTINGWLDKQCEKSVVYVALGSEVDVSKDEIMELAQGLELSGLPFFWAFRKPKTASNSDSDLAGLLPDGFEDRMKGRGLVWKGWAPQTRILSHRSIGGFLTHCGWGSVMEGLSFGVPLIMFPISLDQPLVARVFEEKKVGLEIPRDEQDGSFTSYSVANTIRRVVAEDERKVYRHNAIKMKRIFGDKMLHDRYVDDFVEYLTNHRATLNK